MSNLHKHPWIDMLCKMIAAMGFPIVTGLLLAKSGMPWWFYIWCGVVIFCVAWVISKSLAYGWKGEI